MSQRANDGTTASFFPISLLMVGCPFNVRSLPHALSADKHEGTVAFGVREMRWAADWLFPTKHFTGPILQIRVHVGPFLSKSPYRIITVTPWPAMWIEPAPEMCAGRFSAVYNLPPASIA